MDTMGPLLRPGHVAKILDVSLETLKRMRMRGDGPAWVKVGKQVRYYRDGVTAYTTPPGQAPVVE